MPDLFCNSQEFLDLGAGDFEEHAILLCNYFNYIDMHQGRPNFKSYLLLGTGFPEGRTAYVMRQNQTNNHVELWNPVKGEAYFFGREATVESAGCFSVSKGFKMDKRLNDAICQMTSVGCVVGSDNVWANVQEYETPVLLNYDISDTKCWKPFFTKSSLRKFFPLEKVNTVQLEPIQYMRPMPSDRAEIIAMKIQSFISEKFEYERIISDQKKTKWNNGMEASLADILKKCEMKQLKARQGATNSTLRDPKFRLMQDGDQNNIDTI